MALSKTPQEVIEGSPVDPNKRPVPAEMTTLLTEMRDEYQEFGTALSYASILRESWTALATLAPDGIGQQAEVSPDDTGTHSDPQTSATVDNAGRYTAFGTGAGQWTWVDGGGLASKLSISARLSEFSGPFAGEVRGNIGAASQEDMDAAEAAIADKADAATVTAALATKAPAADAALTGDATAENLAVSGNLSVGGTSVVTALAATADVLTTSPNIFNKNDPDAAEDFRVITSNGELANNVGTAVTGFIPVTAGQQYTFKERHNTAWYDASRVFISGVAASSVNTLTAPDEAAYSRTGYDTTGDTTPDNYWIVQGAEALEIYRPFGGAIAPARVFGLTSESFEDGSVSPEKASFTAEGSNLYDASTILPDFFMNAAGALTASATYSVSDYIPVEEGETYSLRMPPLGGGARFLTAFDSSKAPQSAAGSNSTISSYTVPEGIAFIRATVFRYSETVFQVEKAAKATLYENKRRVLNMSVPVDMLVGSALEPTLNKARLKQGKMRLGRLQFGYEDQINFAAIGDSYSQSAARWTENAARHLVAKYGDGGGGWTGYAFFNPGSTPYVIPSNQPGGVNGNVRATEYPVSYSGTWACTYTGTVSPDMGAVTSSTAGDYIERGVPATPDHTALRVLYIGTADGVVRYRIDGGAWSSNVNVQGTVGNIGSFDIALTGGAHTVQIEVVSGTVTLCGDNAMSDADGVRFHKLGCSGSWIDQWASVDQTQQVAAWALLGLHSVTIMDGTNSQSQGDTTAEWSADMQTLIDRVRLAAATPDLMIMMPPENAQTSRVHPIAAYAQEGRRLAIANRTAYLDLQPYFGDHPDDYDSDADFPLFSSDDIHPDAVSGGRIMTVAWLEMMCVPG
ncbi:SGNH/GDSL hydrolase family protein [Salipiger marinus]|uniref:SGNH hydrolase-type esterase domain-containing protein n=1 Tax=Salipiger marinus TaxID=555512 RepID=A0A1G8PT41_9RHOB|nr:SGNH/GDSL hydrolase family protein [Salipiger marinus]SDI95657.1 hypothetical protein SAMN04487993_1013102 [Salipiger marinus]